MEIIVDSREPKKIVDRLKQELPKGWRLSVEPLDTGDFVCPEKSICIERKTLIDLISSIKDNRLFAQLERASTEFDHVFLLISLNENDLESKFAKFMRQRKAAKTTDLTRIFEKEFEVRSKFNDRAIFGALASISNFASVIITPNPESLTYLSLKLFEKIGRIKYHPKKSSKFLSSRQKIIDGALRNIPRIGPTLAQNIACSFESISDLVRRIDDLANISGISEKRKKIIKELIL